MYDFNVSIVPIDGLASLGVRVSAAVVVTKSVSRFYTELAIERLNLKNTERISSEISLLAKVYSLYM